MSATYEVWDMEVELYVGGGLNFLYMRRKFITENLNLHFSHYEKTIKKTIVELLHGFAIILWLILNNV